MKSRTELARETLSRMGTSCSSEGETAEDVRVAFAYADAFLAAAGIAASEECERLRALLERAAGELSGCAMSCDNCFGTGRLPAEALPGERTSACGICKSVREVLAEIEGVGK